MFRLKVLFPSTTVVISFDLKQIHLLLLLFDSIQNDLKKKSKLEFEFTNENVNCRNFWMECAFDNRFDCDACALSTPIESSRLAIHATVFDWNEIVVKVSANNALKCVFNVTIGKIIVMIAVQQEKRILQ